MRPALLGHRDRPALAYPVVPGQVVPPGLRGLPDHLEQVVLQDHRVQLEVQDLADYLEIMVRLARQVCKVALALMERKVQPDHLGRLLPAVLAIPVALAQQDRQVPLVFRAQRDHKVLQEVLDPQDLQERTALREVPGYPVLQALKVQLDHKEMLDLVGHLDHLDQSERVAKRDPLVTLGHQDLLDHQGQHPAEDQL